MGMSSKSLKLASLQLAAKEVSSPFFGRAANTSAYYLVVDVQCAAWIYQERAGRHASPNGWWNFIGDKNPPC